MQSFVKESIVKIQNAIDKNKLVVFVGAGVSTNSGLPSWSGLIDAFASSVGKKGMYSTDDFLKIPQYYYNERGFKEYYDVITEAFNVKVKPNPIHEIIYELNPAHIVTTNYDDLLEQAALEKGMFYDVVKQDRDLPYTPNNKMIVKMHGDLGAKNVVLKEDDYLSYSTKFKLIENFVKSLFATYTVLFVGYSVNDPDVKLLFQWVKDILKEDFQNAYLLNSDSTLKDIDRIEFEYYRHRGINVLYFSAAKELIESIQINEDDINKLTDEKGKALYRFLNAVKASNKKDFSSAIDELYDKLSFIDRLNRILFEDINKVLGECEYFRRQNGGVFITRNVLLGAFERELRTNLDDYQIEKANHIKRIFYKAGIRKIVIKSSKGQRSVAIDDMVMCDTVTIADPIFNYQYNEVKKQIGITDVAETSQALMKKAYYYYKTGDFLLSYKCTKKASVQTFRDRQYLLFFLSEFNRRQIGRRAIRSGFFSVDDKYKKEIENIRFEIDTIDLDEFFIKIPSHERKKHVFLRDLLNYKLVYKYCNEVVELLPAVEAEQELVRCDSTTDVPIYALEEKIREIWEFFNYNYLIAEDYQEVSSLYFHYIEGIFISYTSRETIKNEDRIFPLLEKDYKVYKLDNISYFNLFIMVRYIEEKELKKLLDRYNITKIEVIEKDKDSFIELFSNLVNSLLEFKLPPSDYDTLSNMLLLCSIIDLGEMRMSMLLNGMIKLLQRGASYTFSNYEQLIKLVVRQTKQFSDNVNEAVVANLLNSYLNRRLTRPSGYDIKANNTLDIINALVYAINTKKAEYILAPNVTCILIEQIKNDEQNKETNVEQLLIPLFRISPQQIKSQIEALVVECLRTQFKPRLYHEAVLAGIIAPSEEFEDILITTVEKIVHDDAQRKKEGKRSLPDPTEVNVGYLVNLIANEKVIDITKYHKFVGTKNIYDLIIDMDNYDFNQFDINWLMDFPMFLIERILTYPEAKLILKAKLQALMLEQEVDRKLKEIFFTFLC